MKHIGAYWMIGCVLMGLVAAYGRKVCPDDKAWSNVETAAGVSIWPVYFMASLAGMKSNRKCDDGSSFRRWPYQGD